jgi:hypothetical protein
VAKKPANLLGTPNVSIERRVRFRALILLAPATAKVASKHNLASTRNARVALEIMG